MKTQMTRFQIHDDLTAPEASLPVLKGALAAPGSSRTSSACSPLARRAARLRALPLELRHGTLPRRRSSGSRSRSADHYGSRARHRAPRAHRPPGRPRHRRGRARREWDSRDDARGRAPALPAPADRARHLPQAPPRGGARGGLDRRAAARGDRRAGARVLHGDGQRRRRRPGRRLGGGDARAARGYLRGDGPAHAAKSHVATLETASQCCPHYHGASSWSASAGRARSSTSCWRAAARCASPRSADAVPDLSDRLLSERMKELEARGIVERQVTSGRRRGSSTS